MQTNQFEISHALEHFFVPLSLFHVLKLFNWQTGIRDLAKVGNSKDTVNIC